MPKRKVVVTGACGTIAGQCLPALLERYDCTLLDIHPTSKDGRVQAEVRLHTTAPLPPRWLAHCQMIPHCSQHPPSLNSMPPQHLLVHWSTLDAGSQGCHSSHRRPALAVGETVILLHPPGPSPFSRRFNSDGERASAK